MKLSTLLSSRLAILGLALLMVTFVSGTAMAQIIPGVDAPDPVQTIVEWGNGHVVEGEVLVQYKQGVDLVSVSSLHGAIGTEHVDFIAEGLEHLRFEGGDVDRIIEAYQSDPRVEYAEPNIIFWTSSTTPNDPSFGQQWGLTKIKCKDAWDVHKGNSSHLCAVVDTGMDMDHPDLATQYAGGYDYYSGDNNPNDTAGHGSHTAGTVAAKTNNATGVAGVAWNCKLLIYRAGNAVYINTTAAVSSINAAKNNGALAISMSWGGSQQSTSIRNALINAYNAGVVPVAAAGNHGTTQKHYPAAQPEVIAVAATTSSDSRASFSAYGSTWVSVAAPGVNILSTYANAQYAWADGTSMACPHVAGAATILYSMIGGARNKANGIAVRDALEQSSVPKSFVEHGRIDLFAAMNFISPPGPPTITAISPASVQAFGGTTVTVDGTNLSSTTEINVGSTVLGSGDFTIVSNDQVTFKAPQATALGSITVTVVNPSGTSNPDTFDYVVTSPPKMECPLTVSGGQPFTWTYGGGVGDAALLFVAPNNSTFPFHGYNILLDYVILYVDYLDAAGLGSLTVTAPSGYGGTWLWTQMVMFSSSFNGASNIATTVLYN